MYAGIDYHKHYSFVSVLDAEGHIILERQIHHKEPGLFMELLEALPEPVAVVYESTFNWSWLYEILEKIPNVASITLANPYKVRLIAEAQIKTDKISSRTLAMLLRVGVIPALCVRIHETVPCH
jgi:transposase